MTARELDVPSLSPGRLSRPREYRVPAPDRRPAEAGFLSREHHPVPNRRSQEMTELPNDEWARRRRAAASDETAAERARRRRAAASDETAHRDHQPTPNSQKETQQS